MIRLITLFCLLGLVACQPKEEIILSEGVNIFGAKIDASPDLTIKEAVAELATSDNMNATIEGTISAVCQAKGCWMTLNDTTSSVDIFVKFKDYAFFVPKNASGQKALVKGVLTMEETSVDEQRHYAEDEGASAETIALITEPKMELKMMADGVIIYN